MPIHLQTRIADQYIKTGLQYYIAARHAALCYSMPVSGNLFHHAIEMFLLAGLLNKYSESDLKKKFIKHNLSNMWVEFKLLLQDRAFNKFNPLITTIQRWEEIRYPRFPRGKSLNMFVDMRKGNKSDLIEPRVNEEDKYRINLEELDEFLKELILALSINPDYIKGLLFHGDSKATYERENQHKLW